MKEAAKDKSSENFSAIKVHYYSGLKYELSIYIRKCIILFI